MIRQSTPGSLRFISHLCRFSVWAWDNFSK